MKLRGLLALLITTLAACGQTGDLYLPDNSTTTAPVATPQSPTEDEKDDEETPTG